MTGNSTGRDGMMGVPARAGWRLWLWWVLVTTVGWTAGSAIGVAVAADRGILFAGALGLAAGGLAAGLLQWWVLLRHIAAAGWWVAVYPAAAAGAILGGMAAGRILGVDAGWVLGVGAYATLLGVLHWLLLRRQVQRAGWWLLASAAGWFVGGPVAGILEAAVGGDLGWAALGAAYGSITGIALMALLRQPAATDEGGE